MATANARSRTQARGRVLVAVGGVASAINGAVHFALPAYFSWGEHTEGLYEPVRWALYATTVFFGVLLVLVGALAVVVALSRDVPWRVVAWVAGGLAVFWVTGAVYEVVVPFPDTVTAIALPVFSLAAAAVLIWGVVAMRPVPPR